MKAKFILTLTVIICGSILLSCASKPQGQPIDPQELIGTKWITVIPFLGITNTLEFIDHNTCIYTLATGPRELSYTIKGNNLIIGKDTYILNENRKVFHYKGNPHFVEEEYAKELIQSANSP